MLATLLIAFAFVLRLVPHPPNFAPLGATAVFAGRALPAWAAVATVLIGHALSNAVLAYRDGHALFSDQTPFVWLGLCAQMWLGRALRTRRGGAFSAAALGSLVFFVSSNFGVWLSGMYGLHGAGLLACYVAAIPFYGATLGSDLLYTAVLCLLYQPLARRLQARGRRWVPVQTTETAWP
jgi:hypothetical protein